MKGKRYKIRISDDPTGVHTWMSREIEEVFIPELGLFINAEASFIGEESSRVPEVWGEVPVDARGCTALYSALVSIDQLESRLRKSLFGVGE